MAKPMIVATHNGTFHADDCFAYAMVRLLLGGDHRLIRTRDPSLLDQATFVFDVGGVYDHSRWRYDHHMRDKPLRPDGVPYSAAGLIWHHHGREILGKRGDLDTLSCDAVWAHVDRGLVVAIDRYDNGVGSIEPSDISSIVYAMNPLWDGPRSPETVDALFGDASAFAGRVLSRSIEVAAALQRAVTAVKAAVEVAVDPRVIELERGMPWEDALFEIGVGEVLYAFHPNQADGTWLATAVPTEPRSFDQRLPFPATWRGLRGSELRSETGVGDAVFCHPAGFICGAESRDGLLELLDIALAQERRLTPTA